MSNIKILVASHKDCWTPCETIYVPISVGKFTINNSKFIKDDTNDNISSKNKNYCELTALYWGWKNLDYDYLGLVHYRRYFCSRSILYFKNKKKILSEKELTKLLDKYDVILPHKRNYYIETSYSQYVHAHHEKDIIALKNTLTDYYPNYVDAFERVMSQRSGHRFNIFIMKKEYIKEYCSWLFDILKKLEPVISMEGYTDYDKRVFGFLAERMLDIWIYTNEINFTELPIVNLESQHWCKKIASFLKRKLKGSLRDCHVI